MITNIIVVAVILVVAFFAFRKGFGKHGPKCDICSCGGCKDCHKFDDLTETGEKQQNKA